MSTSTYAAWVGWLDAFRRGEDPPADALPPIGPGLGSYVEARLLERVAAAFGERVRQWQTALGERIVAHPPADPAEAGAMLRDAVGRLESLERLASSPLLPATLGASMHSALGEVRDGARSALGDAWRRQAEDADEDLRRAAGRAPQPGRRAPGVELPAGRAAGRDAGTPTSAVIPG